MKKLHNKAEVRRVPCSPVHPRQVDASVSARWGRADYAVNPGLEGGTRIPSRTSTRVCMLSTICYGCPESHMGV